MDKLKLPFKISARVTQTFANKLYIDGKDYYAQYGYKGHNGIDYGLPNGTPLYAPHCGTIKEVYYDANGYGWYIKIENDVEGSVLAHLRESTVLIGDYVNQGDLIGYSNNTGFSTGPHLHWGYYRHPRDRTNGYNGFIDQTPYLEGSPTGENNSGETHTIKDFLISVGYSYPEAHLEVIKALYQSDLKLKSGNYILKENCEKEKDLIRKEWENKLSQEKEKITNQLGNLCDEKLEEKEKENLDEINQIKEEHQKEIDVLKDNFEKEKSNAVTEALKNCDETTKEKIEEMEAKVKECEEIKESTAYRVAKTTVKILKLFKLGGK